MEKPNTKVPLLLPMHGKVQTDQNFTRNWDGKPYLTAFFTTRLLPTSEINYLLTADFCIARCNNSNIFQEIRCKTSRYKNSLSPDAINLWNNIITNFKNVPPFASLKAHILSLISPNAKSTFGVRDPLGFRYIFQLRVNLIPLRSHKRRHNFADTPAEICECNQDIEDTSHFLITCPRFANCRANLDGYWNFAKKQPEWSRKPTGIVSI